MVTHNLVKNTVKYDLMNEAWYVQCSMNFVLVVAYLSTVFPQLDAAATNFSFC